MTWWGLLPTLVGTGALVFVPGTVVLRLLGARGLYAWAAGPAVTAAVVAVGATSLGGLEIPWNLATATATTLVAWFLAAGAAWVARRLPRATPYRLDAGLRPRAAAAVLGATGVAALLLAASIRSGMIRPDALLQQWDGVFHLGAVAYVRESGDASLFGALEPLYLPGMDSVYYPTVWHALVAISPFTASVPAAANATTFVLGVGAWLLGLAAMARAALPGRTAAAVMAPVLAAAATTYPSAIWSTSAQMPNAYSLAVLPGACALAIVALRGHAGTSNSWWTAFLAATAMLGVVATHASGAFALLAVLGPLVVGRALGAGYRGLRDGRRRAVLAWTGGVLALVVLLAVAEHRTGLLASFTSYPRAAAMTSSEAVRATVLGFPPPDRPLLNAVLLALVVVGAVVALVRREGRWLVASLVVVAGLVVLAAGPEIPGRWLTGVWYRSHVRVAALLPVPAALLGALGAAAIGSGIASLADRAGTRRPRARQMLAAAAILVVVAAAFLTTDRFRFEEKRFSFAQAYEAGSIRYGTLVGPGEEEMLRRMATELPDDAVLLGDALTGAAYAWPVSGVHVVFPQVSHSYLTPDQKYLAAHFRDLRTDPSVCEIVRRTGITHFWSEPPVSVQATDLAARSPGLFDVDTSSGFEPVLSGDSSVVYRITACDGGVRAFG